MNTSYGTGRSAIADQPHNALFLSNFLGVQNYQKKIEFENICR